MSRHTIFAALRVVPPDLTAPAAASLIFKNDISPEEVPPPDSCSPLPLIVEKFVPTPEPYLNILASLVTKSKIPPLFTKSSFTDKIKHA